MCQMARIPLPSVLQNFGVAGPGPACRVHAQDHSSRATGRRGEGTPGTAGPRPGGGGAAQNHPGTAGGPGQSGVQAGPSDQGVGSGRACCSPAGRGRRSDGRAAGAGAGPGTEPAGSCDSRPRSRAGDGDPAAGRPGQTAHGALADHRCPAGGSPAAPEPAGRAAGPRPVEPGVRGGGEPAHRGAPGRCPGRESGPRPQAGGLQPGVHGHVQDAWPASCERCRSLVPGEGINRHHSEQPCLLTGGTLETPTPPLASPLQGAQDLQRRLLAMEDTVAAAVRDARIERDLKDQAMHQLALQARLPVGRGRLGRRRQGPLCLRGQNPRPTSSHHPLCFPQACRPLSTSTAPAPGQLPRASGRAGGRCPEPGGGFQGGERGDGRPRPRRRPAGPVGSRAP